MAKKKVSPSAAVKTSTTKPSTSTKQTSSQAASNGLATKTPAVLGNEQIGIIAGAIWTALSENGESTLAALKKEIGAPADLVLAGIGWLAREEKLHFTTSGRSVKLSLK